MPRLRSERFLGLELAGAKNQKTTLAVLDAVGESGKLYLLHLYEALGRRGDLSADRVLRTILSEAASGKALIGVNVPLQLPTCVECKRSACRVAGECRSPEVQWVGRFLKAEKNFTPYTQRPVELWLKSKVLTKIPKEQKFEIDEALGGNRAPLTSRMGYLQKFVRDVEFVETLPKLSAWVLGTRLKVGPQVLRTYRQLDRGLESRAAFLTALIREYRIFVEPGDLRRLSRSLAAFDAFLCALTAWLKAQGSCTKPPKGFPVSSGWVWFPS